MTLVIGAVMHKEWCDPLEVSLGELGAKVMWVGETLESLGSPEWSDFDGVVLELTDDVIGSQGLGFLEARAVAGIPVTENSGAIAERAGIENVLWGEVEAQSWLDRLSMLQHRLPGSSIVVWGPSGAPGATTLALGLALEASRTRQTLVIDADFTSPSMAELLELPESPSGLLGALRAARLDSPSVETLLAHAQRSGLSMPGVQVLSGVRPGSLGPLEAASMETLLATLRGSGQIIITEVKLACAENEPSPEVRAVSSVMTGADHIFAITHHSDLGIMRFVRELSLIVPDSAQLPVTVFVRTPRGTRDSRFADARQALWELTGIDDIRATQDSDDPIRGAWLSGALDSVPGVTVHRDSPTPSTYERLLSLVRKRTTRSIT
ncbi:hypothetical protein N9C74_01440 [Pontimonas sp.]|nr:hypothetical protein [Pontimonas sp.]